MEKTRALPPLVCGKVAGILSFFIDEIRIFRDIVLLTGKCDITVQIRWWGEVLPTYIRPQKLHLIRKYDVTRHLLNACLHSATYQIKTRLDLFKSYLQTCEVLELTVLEAVENLVIGSAFLRNLIDVLNKNNKLITLPIINYSGEEIGEIKVHINFSEKLLGARNKLYICQNEKNCLTTRTDEYCKEFTNTKSLKTNFLFQNKQLIDRNSDSYHRQSNLIEVNKKFEVSSFAHKAEENHNTEDPMVSGENLNLSDSMNLSKSFQMYNNENNMMRNLSEDVPNTRFKVMAYVTDENFLVNQMNERLSSKSPEIKILKDSSKLLNFHFQNNKQDKNNRKIVQTEIFDERISNSAINSTISHNEGIKQIRSSNFSSTDYKTDEQIVGKTLCTSSSKVLHSMASKNKSYSEILNTSDKVSLIQNTGDSIDSTVSNDENLGNIFIKKLYNKKVLDYLLGSHMCKEEEESALNDFRKMSPCHNFVTSISNLCIMSNNNYYKSEHKKDLDINDRETDLHNKFESNFFRSNFLKFDLSNPIERKYYEKFFLKSQSQSQLSDSVFDIAEFLNQPVSLSEKRNRNDEEITKFFQWDSDNTDIQAGEGSIHSNKIKNMDCFFFCKKVDAPQKAIQT